MTEETKGSKGFDFDNLTIAGINIKERGMALWNGEIPLVQTFWMYYFLGVFGLKVVGNGIGGPLGVIFGLVALAWAGFMVKPIIAAADKYTGEKQWPLLAKIAAALIGLGVLADLFG